MTTNDEISVRCIRCGHTWLENVRKLGQADSIIFRDTSHQLRIETYRRICTQCGTVNMLEVEFEERRDGR